MFSALSSSIQGTLQRFHRMMEQAVDEALEAAAEARQGGGRPAPSAPAPAPAPSSSSSSAASASTSTAASPMALTSDDVHAVKRALMRAPCNLPLELVVLVLDYAEYWPVLARAHRADHVKLEAISLPARRVADLYLASPPLPAPDGEDGGRVRARPREVRFWVRSRDQGWVSQDRRGLDRYDQSYSWFDASIIRPTSPTASSSTQPLPPLQLGLASQPAEVAPALASASLGFVPRTVRRQRANEETGQLEDVQETEEVGLWRLQSNRVAERRYWEHTIVWKEGDGGDGQGFVEALKEGDRIGVWARAMFPGWANEVEGMAIEVRGSVI